MTFMGMERGYGTKLNRTEFAAIISRIARIAAES
jgi:hypothetical protein